MAVDWDDAFGSDPFGGGQSEDVFGADLGDVDVWKGHDSFDGDQEWTEFNDNDDAVSGAEDDDEDASDGEPVPSSPEKTKTSSSSSSEKKRSKKSGSSSKSRKSSSDRPSSKSRSKSSKDGSSSSGKSKSRSRSSRDKEKSSSSTQSSTSPVSRREGTRRTDSEASGMSSTSNRRDGNGRTDSQSSLNSKVKYLDDDNDDDPFMIGKPVDSKPSSGAATKAGLPKMTVKIPPSERPPTARTSFTDDVLQSSYQTSNRSSSTSSLGGGSSRRSSGAPLVRRRDGTISVRRADHKHHEAKSRDRRASVRDSLFKSLEGVEEDEDIPLPPRSSRGPSLGGFLDNVNEKSGGDSRSGCDRSVSSAPASADEHRRKSQQGKSRRWAKKMDLPTKSGRSSSGGSVGGGDGDVAQKLGVNVAQQGYIEVQDGKMRLVFDVEG